MSPDPALVRVERVDRKADHLRVALVELALQAGDLAELGRADRREVLRVREEDSPSVAQPLVEVDRAVGGLGGEIGGDVAQLKCHLCLLFSVRAPRPVTGRDLSAMTLIKFPSGCAPAGRGGPRTSRLGSPACRSTSCACPTASSRCRCPAPCRPQAPVESAACARRRCRSWSATSSLGICPAWWVRSRTTADPCSRSRSRRARRPAPPGRASIRSWRCSAPPWRPSRLSTWRPRWPLASGRHAICAPTGRACARSPRRRSAGGRLRRHLYLRGQGPESRRRFVRCRCGSRRHRPHRTPRPPRPQHGHRRALGPPGA